MSISEVLIRLHLCKFIHFINLFFYFFKFYMLMQFKTMKHDAIYLNNNTEALCIC